MAEIKRIYVEKKKVVTLKQVSYLLILKKT